MDLCYNPQNHCYEGVSAWKNKRGEAVALQLAPEQGDPERPAAAALATLQRINDHAGEWQQRLLTCLSSALTSDTWIAPQDAAAVVSGFAVEEIHIVASGRLTVIGRSRFAERELRYIIYGDAEGNPIHAERYQGAPVEAPPPSSERKYISETLAAFVVPLLLISAPLSIPGIFLSPFAPCTFLRNGSHVIALILMVLLPIIGIVLLPLPRGIRILIFIVLLLPLFFGGFIFGWAALMNCHAYL